MIITPIRPTTTADQRRGPTFSLRMKNASTVKISGAENPTDVASASCRYCSEKKNRSVATISRIERASCSDGRAEAKGRRHMLAGMTKASATVWNR